MRLFGIIVQDIVDGCLEGYSIDSIPININYESMAESNVGRVMEYEVIYDGYRKFGAFNKEFYKQAKLIKYAGREETVPEDQRKNWQLKRVTN